MNKLFLAIALSLCVLTGSSVFAANDWKPRSYRNYDSRSGQFTSVSTYGTSEYGSGISQNLSTGEANHISYTPYGSRSTPLGPSPSSNNSVSNYYVSPYSNYGNNWSDD